MLKASLYYLSLSVAALAICIYNFNISSNGKDLQCFNIIKMDFLTYQQYNKSLAESNSSITTMLNWYLNNILQQYNYDDSNNNLTNLNNSNNFLSSITITNNTNNNNKTSNNNNTSNTSNTNNTNNTNINNTNTNSTKNNTSSPKSTSNSISKSNQTQINNNKYYDVTLEQANTLRPIQTGIAILYLTMSILSLFLCIIIKPLEDMIPEDFIDVGVFKRIFAMLCKIIPIFFIIMHWFILIMIVIEWIFIGLNNCQTSVDIKNKDNVILNPKKYFVDSYTLNVVTSSFWLIIHYFGTILKDMIYQEPFMYWPEIDKKKRGCVMKVFKKLGP
jgi:hypothetical protein